MSAPAAASHKLEIGPMRAAEVPAVARLHVRWFAEAGLPGNSLAQLGLPFVRDALHGANLGNPYQLVDVARWDGRVIGFCAYVTDRRRVILWSLLHRLPHIAWAALRALVRRPAALRDLLLNLRYVGGERLPFIAPQDAQLTLLAVEPEYRSRAFRERTGVQVARTMIQRMERVLRERGVRAWYAAPAEANPPIQALLEDCGAGPVGKAAAQGARLVYWRRELVPGEGG